MKTFENLIEKLDEVGFILDSNSDSGYYILGYSYTIVAHLWKSYVEVSIFSDNLYKIDFFYCGNENYYDFENEIIRSRKVKMEVVNIEELENLLLTSIIRGSFLTEEEENKVMEETQNISWSISWTQCASKT